MAKPVLLLALIFVASISNAGQPMLGGQVAGLSFEMTLPASKKRLEDVCRSLDTVAVEPPSFPLAREREQHLICQGFETDTVSVDTLALTFADDRLVLLYAQGNAPERLLSLASDEIREYLDFAVSFSDGLVADKAKDRAWLMSQEAAHPNLFQWPNPYVDNEARPEYEASAAVPLALKFGQSLESLKPLFKQGCSFASLGTYDVWLLTKPQVQQQLDCFGYEFAGFPRKIEAVFGDGILEQAWILTGKGEEERVRRYLVQAFGPPSHVDDRWEVFADNRVMLRKDKPEVLMLSERLAPLYREQVVDVR